MQRESYHVEIGDRTIEFEWDGNTLFRDERPVDASLCRIGLDRYSLLYEGRSYRLDLEGRRNGTLRLRSGNDVQSLAVRDRRALMLAALGMDNGKRSRLSVLRAPMPGLIVKVLVGPGDAVHAGDGLLVLEAMKMENELRATEEAIVGSVHVVEGTAVGKNDLLVEFRESDPS